MSLQIIDSEIIKKTQNTLGNIIKKPPLTEKLLSKPPFRFLHDIFTSVIKTTGFMKGLFTETEMVSENVKDKEPKIEFLQKCIDFIALVTDQKVAAKPQKMVAGAEPEKTNEMLQLLAVAVDKNVHNDEYIERFFKKTSDKHENADKHKEKDEEKKKKKDRSSHDKDKERKDSKKRDEDDTEKEERRRKRREERSKKEEGKENEERKERRHHRSKDEKERKKYNEDEHDRKRKEDKDDDNEKKRKNDDYEDPEKAERRRKRREEKEAHKKSDKEERHKRKEDKNEDKENKSQKRDKKESRSKREHRDKSETRDRSASRERKSSKHRTRSKKDDDEGVVASTSNHSKTNEDEEKLHNKGFSRMARPSSARAAPPRLKAKEEEIITPVPQIPTMEKKPEEEDEDDDDDYIIKEDYPPVEEVDVDATKEEDNTDHGNLVKNILETKKEFESSHKNASKNNVYEGIQQKDKELMAKEIEGMREMLQLSSKNINPLGKTMDFLQEDMDSMLKELNVWNEETKNNKALQQNEESKTEAALEPLKTQVRELDQAILMQIDQINAVKCNIINNEKKINQLFSSLFKL